MNIVEDNSDLDDHDYKEVSYDTSISENDSGEGNNSDNEYKREKSELELLREKNIKERDAFLAKLMQDPEYADVVASANELKKSNHRIAKPKRDPSFQYKGQCNIPIEKRRSSRLQKMPPVFFKDLIDEIKINKKRKWSEECDYYDIETVIYHPKKTRTPQNAIHAQIVPVETITDSMIASIARKGSIKLYSQAGTSCHQCRQKTQDQKTYCRSGSCVGVRGQFCGVCLENRYGEDVALALKDPKWQCPVCRGICNCSFCRQKAGKRPTGILAPIAQQTGHKSVKDFLESLRGEGDYAHQDSIWKKLNDPKYLLGYSKDLKFAHLGRNQKHEIEYFLTRERLQSFIRKEENKLEYMKDLHDDPTCLLGFFPFTDMALLDDGTHCFLGPMYLKYEQLIEKTSTEISQVEKEYASNEATRKHLENIDTNRVLGCFLKEVDTKVPELTGNKNLCVKNNTKKTELINKHLQDKSKSLLGFVEGTKKVLQAGGTCCSTISDFKQAEEKEN